MTKTQSPAAIPRNHHGRKPNHLAHTKSPFLTLHAENPVVWYPWCHEAFSRAAREDKSVSRSIGYATCLRCHVMLHESFEDNELAARVNQDFIAIWVDREERPNIDSVNMAVCLQMAGLGG
ncbi:MAG: DUF255 domain-containing protein [Methanomicrobiales archaeon]